MTQRGSDQDAQVRRIFDGLKVTPESFLDFQQSVGSIPFSPSPIESTRISCARARSRGAPTTKLFCAVTFGDHSITAAPTTTITRIEDTGLLRPAFMKT
jgi:hypothetical protein